MTVKDAAANLTWFLAPGRMLVPLPTGGVGMVTVKNDSVENDDFAWNGAAP